MACGGPAITFANLSPVALAPRWNAELFYPDKDKAVTEALWMDRLTYSFAYGVPCGSISILSVVRMIPVSVSYVKNDKHGS